MIDTLARDKIKEWKSKPIKFFIEALGIPKEFVWEKMYELCDSVVKNRRTVVTAGHSVSKSYTVARLVVWYIYTHYPSTVITTAPTHLQVEEILWREIRDAVNNANFTLPGKLTKTKLQLEDKWFALGFATKPDQGQENATKMQGLHNEHVMIVFDEAPGIVKPIWDAKEALLTNEKAKFIAIGNPTFSTGDFVDCISDPAYHHITISCLDTPNYKHGREIIPGLSGKEFVDAIASKYGEDSNQYKSRVLGQVPDSNADSLLLKKWITSAENSEDIGEFKDEKRFVTWDVADGGKDRHVIKGWLNTREIEQVILREKEIEEAIPHVFTLLRKIKGNSIIIDADGIGRVAVGLAEQMADSETAIIPFYGSDRETPDENVYFNMRAYGHWKMRELFESRSISISSNAEQTEELLVLRLKENKRGLIMMEAKDALKRELGRSPDFSDTIMMMAAMVETVEPIKASRRFLDKYSRRRKNINRNYMAA